MGLDRLYDSNNVLVKRHPSFKFSSDFTLTPESSTELVDVGLATSAKGTAAARAAVADWYVSAATGNNNNDGSAAHPLANMAEVANRTDGLIATVKPTIHLLDAPAGTDIDIGYRRLPLGGRILGTTAPHIGVTPTVITTARQESLVAPGTARAITSAGANWAALANPNGQLPRIDNITKGTVIWPGLAETTTRIKVGPANVVNGASFAFPTIQAWTESADGDAISVRALPIIGETRCNNVHIPTGQYLVLENFETNGGDQLQSSADVPSNTGGGYLVYLGCGVGNLWMPPGSGNTALINCRLDQVEQNEGGGVFVIFGGSIFWWGGMALGGQSGVNGFLADGGTALAVFGGRCDLHAPVGIFGCVGGTGCYVAYRGYVNARDVLYGSNNTYGIQCVNGGLYEYSAGAGHKPVILGETANILLDDASYSHAQAPVINAATGSGVTGLTLAGLVSQGQSTAIGAPTTTGAFNWDTTAQPQGHCIATGNCTITPINLGPCCKARLEFVPGASHRTLALSGVTFTTQFTQAALITLCGTAVSIFVDVENRRGTIYVMSVVSS